MRWPRIFRQENNKVDNRDRINDVLSEVKQSKKDTVYCSFCGESQHEVSWLIAGPTVFICNDCLDKCDDVLLEKKYPDRIVVRVNVPHGTHLDDTLYEAVARVLNERFPGIDLKYEFKTLNNTHSKSDTPVILTFTFGKLYGSTPIAEKTYEDISSELSKAVAQMAVLQEQYVHENERVRSLNNELVEIKEEYLSFLRERVRVDNEQSELSAVLFVDVKGFSQLEFEEKKKVLDLIRGIVPTLIVDKGAQHVNMWGDGIVAVFSDVNKAIECAVKFLRHLGVEHLEARIGMAWGKVRVSYNPAIGRTDIDGAVVDRAARLEPMAEPGEVLLSTEFGGHKIDPSLGELIRVKLLVKKAFAGYNVGDEIEVFRLKVLMN